MAKILITLAVVYIPYLVSAADDNFLRFYTGTTPKEYTDYDVEDGQKAVTNSAWNSSNPVAIYFHGMNENVDSEGVITVTSALRKRGGWNVCAFNYATQAKYSGIILDSFAHLVTQSGVAGETAANLLNRFVEAGVPASSFYLIGYSTGAHVAGHAAREAEETFPRITALDPQIHGWFLFSLDDHLWSTDATVVDVIHTNGILMGVSTALGTADFYPNSGYALQPGCSYSLSTDVFYCSSDVSWKLFAESVTNPTALKAISCNSWTEFQTGSCKGVTDYMGYGFSQKAKGNFYLQTNSKPAYSKGASGIIYNPRIVSALSSTVIEWLASILKFFLG